MFGRGQDAVVKFGTFAVKLGTPQNDALLALAVPCGTIETEPSKGA